MTTLRPFFLLVGRASVFWLGAIGLAVVSLIVAGMAEPENWVLLRFDPVIMAAFLFPMSAGWLAGALVQELQHTTFAFALPGVRRRVASGFLVAGVAVATAVVGAIAIAGAPATSLPVLFAFALGAYGLGGTLNDPLSRWITTANVVVVLGVVYASDRLSRIATEHPLPMAIVALGLGTVCCVRLFARGTFRRKPFRESMPLPGRFSLERADAVERRRRIERGPSRARWRIGALGGDTWKWVRAAFHEVHVNRGWQGMARAVSRAWGIGLIVLIAAWAEKGDMGFGEALARLLHDALLRSPHVPPFGAKGGPYMLVILAIATAGALVPLLSPVALGGNLAYPLSRAQRAKVSFRGGLVDVAFFLAVAAPFLFALGQLMGWAVGIEIRFDFVPLFFRALLVTVILMPLVHRGRLRLQAATRRRSANSQAWVIVGIIGFVTLATVASFLSAALFPRPATELTVLAVALVGSQLLYRRKLNVYYRTADLA